MCGPQHLQRLLIVVVEIVIVVEVRILVRVADRRLVVIIVARPLGAGCGRRAPSDASDHDTGYNGGMRSTWPG